MPLFGRTKVSDDDKAAAIAYYEKAFVCVALQDKYAESYNNALVIHMNSLSDPESVAVMLNVSKQLAQSAKDLAERHAQIAPVPDIAAGEFAAWTVGYMAYLEWAQAQHGVFVAISDGRTPAGERIPQLMAECERTKRQAEDESKRMLKAVGLSGAQLQRMTQAAYAAMKE